MTAQIILGPLSLLFPHPGRQCSVPLIGGFPDCVTTWGLLVLVRRLYIPTRLVVEITQRCKVHDLNAQHCLFLRAARFTPPISRYFRVPKAGYVTTKVLIAFPTQHQCINSEARCVKVLYLSYSPDQGAGECTFLKNVIHDEIPWGNATHRNHKVCRTKRWAGESGHLTRFVGVHERYFSTQDCVQD